ncbi:MAG: 2-succinyl-5-enolpyruvyl-6-hydroxy-3-cyclohexene-1-carboxylic-acid synthase [Porphyromonas sp.]|nr:2-succinyl-5-enolpyruvyl-6-hydroxy-3-cyclohexene-1-carboxylic-acid synthase [Porphyromonas sp.]
MYSDKEIVRQLTSLLVAHGVTTVVLCPGSRNAPIVHTLANHEAFVCHSVTDERSAGFYALGMALSLSSPVAVCCTSGTALLNLFPAVAEAYYQKVPLLIISADRPEAWIDQMAGQTIHQPFVFEPMVRKSVQLPEIKSGEDRWYCNRLINEALLALQHRDAGPVHINVPLSEPLFDFSDRPLTDVRSIRRVKWTEVNVTEMGEMQEVFAQSPKTLVVAGQMDRRVVIPQGWQGTAAWLYEHLSNQHLPLSAASTFDTLLAVLDDAAKEELRPDLLITFGGSVVSKRVKEYLRQYPPKVHWHLSESGELIDLYCSLSTVIESPIELFFRETEEWCVEKEEWYRLLWNSKCGELLPPSFDYSAMSVAGEVMKSIGESPCTLHIANSSVVRHAQLFPLSPSVRVCCNRGTNGIDGSLSTAIGYALLSKEINYVMIGDLSFFYDMNALWQDALPNHLRIVLFNNGGGGIFHTLPTLSMTSQSETFIAAPHHSTAKGWAEAQGLTYMDVRRRESVETAIQLLTRPDASAPVLVEVFTSAVEDKRLLERFYLSNKARQNIINSSNK